MTSNSFNKRGTMKLLMAAEEVLPGNTAWRRAVQLRMRLLYAYIWKRTSSYVTAIRGWIDIIDSIAHITLFAGGCVRFAWTTCTTRLVWIYLFIYFVYTLCIFHIVESKWTKCNTTDNDLARTIAILVWVYILRKK